MSISDTVGPNNKIGVINFGAVLEKSWDIKEIVADNSTALSGPKLCIRS